MTAPLLWLPAALARFRASVRLVAGWETRTAKRALDCRWLVCHHTASVPWSGDDANRNVVVNGNAVAPGPIAQLLVQRSGVVEVIAAGSSNNAGAGTLPDGGTDGNAQPGIETVNAGAGMQWAPGSNRVVYGGSVFTLSTAQLVVWQQRVDAGELVRDPSTGMWWEVWPERQLVGYAAAAAAICDHFGWSADRLVAHAQYAPLRKVDPAGPWFDDPTRPLRADAWMTRFRGLVQLMLDTAHQPAPTPIPTPAPTPTTPTEDDMPPELIRFAGFWNEILECSGGPIHGTPEQVQRWRPAYGVPAPAGTLAGLVTGGKMALVIDPDDHPAKFKSTLTRLGLTVSDLSPSEGGV